MHNGNISPQAVPRSCRSFGSRLTTAAVLLAALSCGSATAAQAMLGNVPAAAVPAHSIQRAPKASGADRILGLIRSYAGRSNVPSDRSRSWAEASADPVVWFTLLSGNVVNSYDANGRLVGSLAGLSKPFGVALDKSGNVYVANSGAQQVLIYKKGATAPTLTLDDRGYLPFAVAIDADGSVAVANACSVGQQGCNGNGNTLIYKKGATEPSLRFTGGFTLPQAVAFDASGKLWETGYNGSTGAVVGYYGPGEKTFHVSKIPLVEPTSMQFDSMGNLDIVDDAVSPCPANPGLSCSVLFVYKPGRIVPSGSFVVGQASSDLVTGIALDKGSNALWAADEFGDACFGFLYAYPAGKLLIRHTIVFPVQDGRGVPYGVAVQP